MTEEKDICNDNERKTAGSEEKTKTSFQVQKQNAVNNLKGAKEKIFKKRSPIIANLEASYAPILNSNSAPNLNVQKKIAVPSALYLYRAHSFAILSAIAKVSCCLGVKLGSMSRGGLRFNGKWSVVGVVVLLVAWVGGSEFPERECCDPVYPPNTATTAAAPITPPIPKLTGIYV